MNKDESRANADVLAFYRELPFNYRESALQHAKDIRRNNAVGAGYDVLVPLLRNGPPTVLDVGCGAGWFSLNVAYHYGCVVTGIDYNEIAIDRARDVAKALGVKVRFETADLFQFRPPERFDLVASIGVLHHTNDCPAAVRRVCIEFVKPGGHVFIGLYHSYGRRPFLEHFRRMREAGRTEEDMLTEYRRLHPLPDETHLRSWFRDQVLHPHETAHTLDEMLPILDATGMTLLATSINRFAPIENLASILDAERGLEQLAAERLAQGRYFPGFFVFLASKVS
jgi:2-polyprenyl-3-methyl-5-hydroxy-6-metoxy-1,4-benzoquinol methylase